MKNKKNKINSPNKKYINKELISSIINCIKESKNKSWIFLDSNEIDNSKICLNNLQKKFKICGLENKDIKKIQTNEEEKESIEINDDNFMEIVEKTLASIKIK